MVRIQGLQYEVIENVKDGWDEEAFKERYSDVLNKYDYIVGDWGYSQLRLRGFYEDHHKRSTYDTKISTLTEYLYEYCNFGCSYFVIKRLREASGKEEAQKDA